MCLLSTRKTRQNILPDLVHVAFRKIEFLHKGHFTKRVFTTSWLAQTSEGLAMNLKIVV